MAGHMFIPHTLLYHSLDLLHCHDKVRAMIDKVRAMIALEKAEQQK